MDKTDLLINTFQPVPPIGSPISHKDNSFLPFLQVKNSGVMFYSFLSHPTSIKSANAVSFTFKISQNLIISHISTSTTLAQTVKEGKLKMLSDLQDSKNIILENSLVVQWLRLWAPNARGRV